MDYFHCKDGEWWCEGVPLLELAQRFGTPLYVYSERTLVEHFLKLDQAFRDVPHLVCYSVKANGNLAILRALAQVGSGADVVSGGELERAMRAGIPPDRIVYSGVGKTDEEIRAAVSAGIRAVNVENEEELHLLSAIAEDMGRIQRIALRVNPDVDPHTHEYLTTGRTENKFGIPLERALEVAERAASLPGVALTGVDFHIGSQILSHEPYALALSQARGLVTDLRQLGFSVEILDIGGGLAARYDHERPMTADEFHDGIVGLIRDLDLTLVLEPGRFIVANAGVLLTRVLFVKETPRRAFVIADAGMNDLIRPTLYGAIHRIEPVTARDGEYREVDVVGPICESGDFLARGRALPPVRRGDVLVVFSAGAYGMAMSSNYNQRGRAAEVLVSGREATLVRRRETYEDLIRCEVEVSRASIVD